MNKYAHIKASDLKEMNTNLQKYLDMVILELDEIDAAIEYCDNSLAFWERTNRIPEEERFRKIYDLTRVKRQVESRKRIFDELFEALGDAFRAIDDFVDYIE